MPLQSKVLLLFGILLLLIFFQWLFFMQHEERLLRDEMTERGRVLVKTLAELSREPFLNSQISRLEMQLDSIITENDVLYARVVDSNFLVLADTRREQEGWTFSGNISMVPEIIFGKVMLIVRQPIVILDTVSGMAEISFSLGSMNQKINSSRILFIILFISEMTLGLLLGIFLEIQVVRPLHRLAAEVENIPVNNTGGDFSVPGHSSVEILKVNTAIGNMWKKLKKNQEEIIAKTKFATMGKIGFNLAHEIRNPLEAISGAVEILKSGIDVSASDHDYLQIIEEEIHNLNDYLTEFLEFTRSEPGSKAAVSPSVLIHDCLLLLGSLLKKNKIEIINHPPGTGRSCLVDTNQIKRVILNVALNSIESIINGGIIEIETGDSDKFIFIKISDNGTGIRDENIMSIFDPYYSTKKDGSGIGLALCHKIIEQHEGLIEVSSKEGKGTTMIIKLPAV